MHEIELPYVILFYQNMGMVSLPTHALICIHLDIDCKLMFVNDLYLLIFNNKPIITRRINNVSIQDLVNKINYKLFIIFATSAKAICFSIAPISKAIFGMP